MIALPKHEPCGLDGAGEPLPGNIMHAHCDVLITWTRVYVRGVWKDIAKKAIGCGALSKVCGRCGLRAVWNDGPCGACERRET